MGCIRSCRVLQTITANQGVAGEELNKKFENQEEGF